MDMSALEGLLGTLDSLRWALTAPGFRNFVVLFVGWVQTQGVHAVTSALVETDVARRTHHERFHRFFSRGTSSPDEMGRLLFLRLLRLLPPDIPVRVVLDDTLAPKKGPHIFGLGSHRDPVRSTTRCMTSAPAPNASTVSPKSWASNDQKCAISTRSAISTP